MGSFKGSIGFPYGTRDEWQRQQEHFPHKVEAECLATFDQVEHCGLKHKWCSRPRDAGAFGSR